ncbi:MAG: DUF302 domain-containing protein [Gammaproteobacteria bacterium]|nr:DUF302 domain-containing protein [Gammaproteobacteria bacterium]NNJ84712.1 DUF302 domain-containing protein [Gammaproteobacteria bacterium]
MYGFKTTLQGPFANAIERVTEELKKEGFGVLSDINVQATLKAKLDLDYLPYRILGACNPTFGNRALTADMDIGMLLPCNVVVRQEADQSITVAFMDPVAVMAIADQAAITELAGEVRGRLERVRDALT